MSSSMTASARRRLPLVAVLLSAAACAAAAQPATAEAAPETPAGVGIKVSFRPSVAIVVGIFTMIFSLTFLLLMYAKFCHPSGVPATGDGAVAATAAAAAVTGGEEGVAKAVIESLPFFRFAALRGARQGLECAVCLARFDDADLLRLLPRCRHAFHLDCVDRWLESKASCPLCRARVDADPAAALGLKYAACSARFVFGSASDRFDADPGRDLLGIFVERVPSSRMAPAAAHQQQQAPHHECLDRYNHRILVSDAVFKSRWSEINSSDLIALDNQLLRHAADLELDLELYGEAADRHRVSKEETTTDRRKLLDVDPEAAASSKGGKAAVADAARMISSGVRSMSEMVSLPRLRLADEEDQARRRWVPIARRTARWLAGREIRRQHVNDAADEAVDSPPAPHDSHA
uniref:RING-type E3 ubiquitin transferase n=1 Tax=Leersia perrieri TaxID=77586 RepID=A0A0D9WKM3_9ORYZ